MIRNDNLKRAIEPVFFIADFLWQWCVCGLFIFAV